MASEVQAPARIALVITGLGLGGAEAMLFKLLQRLDRRRFAPAVVSLTDVGEYGPRIEGLGIPVHAMGMRPGLPSPVALLRLVRTLSALEPDLVHTWMYHADLLGGLSARLAGVSEVVWGIRHTDLSRGNNKASTLMVVKLCASLSGMVPRRILSCSDRARENHVRIRYAASKFRVIPNGFELERFAPGGLAARVSVRAELGLIPSTPLVGHIGRFHPQKNHAGLLGAFAAIHQQMREVHFLLAGPGVQQGAGQLWRMVTEAGLESRCHLLGQREDIPRLLSALDVLASSSHGEAFPNVLGEAMACEVPCAVTDVGDCAEIVGDTGRVVPAGDMEDLARAVLDLLRLPLAAREALGRRARARIASRYEIGDVVRQYEDFYLETLRQA